MQDTEYPVDSGQFRIHLELVQPQSGIDAVFDGRIRLPEAAANKCFRQIGEVSLHRMITGYLPRAVSEK